MTLLRLLNLIFFGPKVTAPQSSFTAVKDPLVEVIGPDLQSLVRKLYGGRALRIWSVDAGSTHAEELEIAALTNAYYDIERFGLSLVGSPRHADIIFVTGPVARNMVGPLQAAYAAAPQPCVVVAIGDGACTGGIWKDSYAVAGPVEAVIPVHVRIPGDTPSPTTILCGLLQALQQARH